MWKINDVDSFIYGGFVGWTLLAIFFYFIDFNIRTTKQRIEPKM